MIDFGIITAPRKEDTFNQSISSLRKAGVKDPVFVFSEPQERVWPDNIFLFKNDFKRGAFKNHHHALITMIEYSEKDYICVLLDDMIYSRGFIDVIEARLKSHVDNFGYHALITINADIEHEGKSPEPGWFETKLGWNSWGGLYVMRKDIAARLVKQSFYVNHLNHYKKNEQIDACISETFKRMKLPMYLHNPSLADHIGYTSTLDHGALTDKRKGYKFKI